MTLTTTEARVVPGDWRTGANGTNRKAHLFVLRPGERRETTACHAKANPDTYRRVQRRKLTDLCFECLAYGASGR